MSAITPLQRTSSDTGHFMKPVRLRPTTASRMDEQMVWNGHAAEAQRSAAVREG
jgi:hypothetical protein